MTNEKCPYICGNNGIRCVNIIKLDLENRDKIDTKLLGELTKQYYELCNTPNYRPCGLFQRYECMGVRK